MSEPLRVALPLGIGDCHWSCQKLRGLSEKFNRPIHAYVNSSAHHVSVNYLSMVPFIEKAVQSPKAPFNICGQLPPCHKSEKWLSLEGARGWNGFDYVVQANGLLEVGGRIEQLFPEVPTDYSYELNIPQQDRDRADLIGGELPVLFYLSGIGPNSGFHHLWWAVAHWIELCRLFNSVGVEPVLIGSKTEDDRNYLNWFLSVSQNLKFKNLVGETEIPEVCALIENASVWIGLNSGLGIVSAMRKVPTIMMWADNRFPETKGNVLFPPVMQKSWLNDDFDNTYSTFSYGSPDLTPENVFKKAQEIRRY
jgi:hypothetical protein